MEGDANARYCHACVCGRRRRNQLLALRKGDLWVEDVEEIKSEVKCHFQNFFLEHNDHRSVLDGVHFPQISEDDNDVLTAPFRMEEVKEAVWRCEGIRVRDITRVQFYILQAVLGSHQI